MQYGADHFASYSAVDCKKYSLHWWANRYYAKLIQRFVKAGRVLEVGCGTGFLLAELGRHFETYGIDISDYALANARRNCPCADLHHGRAEDLTVFGDGFFDAIVSKHVFEHLADPGSALKECSRLLRPSGTLLFIVPNMSSLTRRLKKSQWYGYRDVTHVSLLYPSSWIELIRESGLNVFSVSSDGFWDTPYVSALPVAIQKLLFGSLGGIQALLGFAFQPVPFGESLVVLARKEGR